MADTFDLNLGTLGALNVRARLILEKQATVAGTGVNSGGRSAALAVAARVAEGERPLERAGVRRGVAAEHGVEERVAGDLGAQGRQVLRRFAQCFFILEDIWVFLTYHDASEAAIAPIFEKKFFSGGESADSFGGELCPGDGDDVPHPALEPAAPPVCGQLARPRGGGDEER